jgi:hypothetical protein
LNRKGLEHHAGCWVLGAGSIEHQPHYRGALGGYHTWPSWVEAGTEKEPGEDTAYSDHLTVEPICEGGGVQVRVEGSWACSQLDRQMRQVKAWGTEPLSPPRQ